MDTASQEAAAQRSRTMRAVRSKNTTPEMAVRRHLHAAGLRYRLHDPRLPGKPDLVFPARRIALFVHGCFWHQHPDCKQATRPASNNHYWDRKLSGNVSRDVQRQRELRDMDWYPMVIWECETRNPHALDALLHQIRNVPAAR